MIFYTIFHKASYLLAHPEKIILGKQRCSFALCPQDDLPSCVRKRPSFITLSFCFLPKEDDRLQSELARILGVEKKLPQKGLYLKLTSSCVSRIDLTGNNPLIYVHCPRMPSDLEAKIDYRRSNHNPNKKVKIFGFQAMITTSIEVEIGLELPVGCVVSSAEKSDGSHLIPERRKFIREHELLPSIDIGDAGFDVTDNFQYVRSTGSIPIIDYNRRGERTDPATLLMRGYDERGTPFAPCGTLCKSNGYDERKKRVSYMCRRQCLTSPSFVSHPIPGASTLQGNVATLPICPSGLTLVWCVKFQDHQRDGKKTRNLRSASERTNGITKEADLNILESPRVFGLTAASIEATTACITTPLKMVMKFIVRVTLNLIGYLKTWKKSYRRKLEGPKAPACILSLIQRRRAPP